MSFSIDKREVEEIIFSFLPKEEGPGKRIREAMSQGVKNGGKRIRPLLMQSTYRLFSEKNEDFAEEVKREGKAKRKAEKTTAKTTDDKADKEKRMLWPFLAAMEMIHSFSLVHDDLPSMDNDELRRGQPTTWKVFGEAIGVLAGDGLLNHAYFILARGLEMLEDENERGKYIRCMSLLSHYTGVDGMIGGQTVDILLTGREPTEKEIRYIYEKKTGALIRASMEIGGILGGASKEEEEKIVEIADLLGMAYQIKDDILDIESSSEMLGKPVLSDEKNHKMTYVALYGMEAAKETEERLSQKARSLLSEIARTKVSTSPEKTDLSILIEGLLHRKK